MRVLVACEYSGRVGGAFGALGHEVVTVDLLPTEGDTSLYTHHQGDVLEELARLRSGGWVPDLLIAHPPCTYLTNAGARWLYRDGRQANGMDPQRWEAMASAANFFRALWEAAVPRVAVENPVMHGHAMAYTQAGRPTQVVQPWMFGHREVKATGLWLRGLPPLVPTDNVREAMLAETTYAERARVHHASPSPDRWKLRSLTYQGLADAMALQWGSEW